MYCDSGNAIQRALQLVVRRGEGGLIRNFAGEMFLPGDENLRRSDFNNSNLFQS